MDNKSIGEAVVKGVMTAAILGLAIGAQKNTINRAYGDAGGLVVKALALGAAAGIHLIVVLTQVNGIVWAFRHAHVAIDATDFNHRCHALTCCLLQRP